MKQKLLNLYYKLLGSLARKYIAKTKPYIVGFNGSVGKTSCRMIVAETLQQLLPEMTIYTSPKNFNGELGMSISIFEIPSFNPGIGSMISVLFTAIKKNFSSVDKTTKPKILLLEYGIDHPGEMEFLLTITKPHCSIHTQIDSVHSMQFGNPDNIAREEFLLQQYTIEHAFVNQDDTYLERFKSSIPCDILTYSATGVSENTTIKINYSSEKNGSIQQLQQADVIFNKTKSVKLAINILGKYHMSYAAVGVCLADILSYKFLQHEAVKNGDDITLKLHLQPGRRSVFEGVHENIIIDSSYNASPRSVKYLLDEITERRNTQYPAHKLIFVLGDMRELGTQEHKEHTDLAVYLQQHDAVLMTVGECMKTIVLPYLQSQGQGRLQSIQHFANFEEVGRFLQGYLLQHNNESYIVVFKGSQNTIFLEEAVKYVLVNESDKTHLTRQGDQRLEKKQMLLKKSQK